MQLQPKTYLLWLHLVCSVAAVTQKMGLKMKKGEVRRIETPQDAAMTDLSNVPWLIPPWTLSCVPVLLHFEIFLPLIQLRTRKIAQQQTAKSLHPTVPTSASFSQKQRSKRSLTARRWWGQSRQGPRVRPGSASEVCCYHAEVTWWDIDIESHRLDVNEAVRSCFTMCVWVSVWVWDTRA